MDEVSMHDGLDAPETVAFGLGAAETAALVLSLLLGYAAVATLPAVVAWPLAAAAVGGGALLAWGRCQDRSLLTWAVLVARFAVRHRGRSVVVADALTSTATTAARTGWEAARALPRSLAAAVRRPVTDRAASAGFAGDGPARAVVRLVPLPAGPMAPPRPVSCRVAFFALRGGAGRTTLACEVAALMAARGPTGGGAGPGWGRPRTALLDLDDGLPGASLRLGIPLVPDRHGDGGTQPGGGLRRHPSGLLVRPGTTRPWRPVTLEMVQAAVAGAEAAGAGVTVLDVACGPGPTCEAVMGLCDHIVVVVEPTATGILDAYRSTAVLRELGLRERLLYVANRCVEEDDLGDLEADLRVRVLVRIPHDAALAAGAGAGGTRPHIGGPAATALSLLATQLGGGALRGRHAGEDAGATRADAAGVRGR